MDQIKRLVKSVSEALKCFLSIILFMFGFQLTSPLFLGALTGVVLSMLFVHPVHAQVMSVLPAWVNQAKTDVVVTGTLVLSVIVAGTAFIWLRMVVQGGTEDVFQFQNFSESGSGEDGVSNDAVDSEDVIDFFDDGESRSQTELEAAMASWETGFEAQLLKQDAGEYTPYDFIGSQVAIESGIPETVDVWDERHPDHDEMISHLEGPEGDALPVEFVQEHAGVWEPAQVERG